MRRNVQVRNHVPPEYRVVWSTPYLAGDFDKKCLHYWYSSDFIRLMINIKEVMGICMKHSSSLRFYTVASTHA